MSADRPDETTRREQGGFNPSRPQEKQMPQVGPMPTDDPRGKAKREVDKTDLEDAVKKTRKQI